MGGPADVRELPGLTISKLAVSDMANNAYLLRDTATGEALLIDAAADPEALRALIGDADLRTVVTTHGHWDHHRALPDVVVATGATTVAARRPTHPTCPSPSSGRSSTATPWTVGGQTLEVIHLRGHTPGSIALVWRGPGDAGVHVFTGDSLFPGGVGNTQKDAARFSQPDRRRRAAAVRRCRTRRGSTPATARTRRSAPSARTSPSGAPAAGDPRRPRDRRDGAWTAWWSGSNIGDRGGALRRSGDPARHADRGRGGSRGRERQGGVRRW